MESRNPPLTNITQNIGKVKNSISSIDLVTTITTIVILITSPIIGPASTWVEILFGTSGPDTLVGTENDE